MFCLSLKGTLEWGLGFLHITIIIRRPLGKNNITRRLFGNNTWEQ
ncbi:hypothetical protein [Dulcicalothrix desertica]|nr:hypothetical protein [Dulcicalothrix desertica]